MKFTDDVEGATKESWEKSLNHPLVQGIVKGDLPLETFKYYILQDIYYLKHYGKVHAIAASQAEDFDITALLAQKAQKTAQAELTVHNEHARILNITDEDMKHFKPAPTAYAYTSHLYRATMFGHLAHSVAAMLPCYWLYADIGKKNENANPAPQIYQNWIKMYAGAEFQNSTNDMINLLNMLVENMNEHQKEQVKEQFIIAKEYELHFWKMSYTFEKWLSHREEAGL